MKKTKKAKKPKVTKTPGITLTQHEFNVASAVPDTVPENAKEEPILVRWEVLARYRKEGTDLIQIKYRLKEIFDLHDLIENGPNFHTVEEIIIRKVPWPGFEGITLKETDAM